MSVRVEQEPRSICGASNIYYKSSNKGDRRSSQCGRKRTRPAQCCRSFQVRERIGLGCGSAVVQHFPSLCEKLKRKRLEEYKVV
jgi:hypothetical protein